ncbi:MAG TPA: AraC family transcriptional regulator [Candidatus Faecalibacterium faecigallinarum]|uniref:AraC family transcriptional regulator n=1 Tax=Candidatus Faecalibacterium faecigallinarum TaxID=2838577 RepID=A0A9D2PC77_9FIRM|nr:AraC family transcriptional regulator [Candidatus Faecalibacterium faecigallinarum]HJD21941.1 AraC family transcriptional regulator [Candidatus Gemmiger faecigallinarum]
MSTARFAISHAPAPRESFRLLYISKSRFGGDWNSTAHTHACTELFYCLSGEGQFFIQGQLYPVQPDDLVIVNPQVEHTELSLNAAPLEYVVLGISGIEVLFGSSDEPYAILNCREQRERLGALLHMLLAEADHSLDGYETVCQDLLEVLLIWLVRSSTLSVQLQRTTVRAENRECAEIKRYIDTNYRESITLDKLAGMAHLNKYYLSHAFQKEYGISPITYLSRRRIEESKYLLGNTSHTLAQVSELLGFSSPSYFSQCFRKAEGISPNEYRRQVREGKRPAPPKRR